MSWANYYRAVLPERSSARDILAAARHIVAVCALPPIDLEARWTVPDARPLAGLAERLRAIAAPADRRVDFTLLPADPWPSLELLRRCPHAVELELVGPDPSPALSMTLHLERPGDVDRFTVSIELRARDARTCVSEDVRAAAVSRLDDCRRAGLLPDHADPASLVERFLAAAAQDGADLRLVHGLPQDGYRLVCRSWRRREPSHLLVVHERPSALDPSRLAALWQAPPCLGGRLRGEQCIATAARLGGEFIDLEVEVTGEAELDAVADAAGDDPVVAAWWCGFDGWGRAYHGVRLALNGQYQDGRARPDPGRHELVVLVDAKRRDPGAHEVAAALAARAGIALEYLRGGL